MLYGPIKGENILKIEWREIDTSEVFKRERGTHRE